MNVKKPSFDNYFNLFLKSFFKGLLIVGPIGATLYIIFVVFDTIDSLIPFDKFFPFLNRTGVGFVSLILFISAVGYFFNKFVFGKFIFESLDHFLEKTPGVKHIYSPTKDVMSSFVGDKKKFNVPVWVKTNENPEIWRIGFLTQKDMSDVGLPEKVAVYLPHSYAISGWVIMTNSTYILPVEGMSAAEAMKFAVSGGVAGFHSDKNVFKAPE
ncbi:MAG: DUF502 domain-containing protein [Cloacibacterium sp.]|jgi:uncharacterized membrane protein|nr:DUF502 domain-containing protein [Cloacibacterium sp.]